MHRNQFIKIMLILVSILIFFSYIYQATWVNGVHAVEVKPEDNFFYATSNSFQPASYLNNSVDFSSYGYSECITTITSYSLNNSAFVSEGTNVSVTTHVYIYRINYQNDTSMFPVYNESLNGISNEVKTLHLGPGSFELLAFTSIIAYNSNYTEAVHAAMSIAANFTDLSIVLVSINYPYFIVYPMEVTFILLVVDLALCLRYGKKHHPSS